MINGSKVAVYWVDRERKGTCVIIEHIINKNPFVTCFNVIRGFMTIKEQLNNLNEPELREKVIIPLFRVLGCSFIKSNCGRGEKGKDIIYRINHQIFKDEIFTAVIINNQKDINIRYITAIDNRLNRQRIQALENFNDPWHLTKTVKISELVLVTSYAVTDDAEKHIFKHWGINFPAIRIISGDDLANWIKDSIEKWDKGKNIKDQDYYIFNINNFRSFCEIITGDIINESIDNILTLSIT
mgnify:CR=1 FL=1